jgi:hypothetical protein
MYRLEVNMPWEPFPHNGGVSPLPGLTAQFWEFMIRTIITIFAILKEEGDIMIILFGLLAALLIVYFLVKHRMWEPLEEGD